jgi:hypothetical protein
MHKLPIPKGKKLLLVAAIAAAFFMASGISLWHVDAPGSEAACAICHFAHIPVLPGLPVRTLSAPSLLGWVGLIEKQAEHSTPVSPDSSPRAPPA